MPEYEIRELQKQLKVYADGRYVAAVQQGKFRPYVYPLFTPAGHNVLQIAPADHLHHLGIFFSHSAVSAERDRGSQPGTDQTSTAVDFWSAETFQVGPLPQILVRATDTAVTERGVEFDQAIEWIDGDGGLVVRERRITTIAAGPQGNTVDLVTTLEAPGNPVILGQAKDAGIGVRVADQIDVVDGGRIVNANGQENEAETFGQVSAWVDYSGPATPETTAGVAVFLYPDARVIPWHTRDYGPMWINPWQHAPMTLAVGETYTIGAHCVAHDGSCEAAGVAGLYATFQEELRAWAPT